MTLQELIDDLTANVIELWGSPRTVETNPSTGTELVEQQVNITTDETGDTATKGTVSYYQYTDGTARWARRKVNYKPSAKEPSKIETGLQMLVDTFGADKFIVLGQPSTGDDTVKVKLLAGNTPGLADGTIVLAALDKDGKAIYVVSE